MRLRLLALTVVFSVFITDAMVKRWAERSLMHGVPEPVLDTLVQWRLGYNTGIAFGLFATGGPTWVVLSGLIIAGLSAWFIRLLASPSPQVTALPVALMLGGALANFLDRWQDGQVTDYLDLGLASTRWPTFNLADAALTVGASLLVIIALHAERALGQR